MFLVSYARCRADDIRRLVGLVYDGLCASPHHHSQSHSLGMKEMTLPVGVKKIYKGAFDNCKALERIYVPAKKTDYYKSRLPEELHSLIVELQPEKKAKAKK